MRLMKGYQDGHDFTDTQGTSSLASFLYAGKQLLVPEG
jgi:hypothetical protein